MFGIPLAFGAPAVLIALAGLGALYYLLRVTPPAAAAGAAFRRCGSFSGFPPGRGSPHERRGRSWPSGWPSRRSSSSPWRSLCGGRSRGLADRGRCSSSWTMAGRPRRRSTSGSILRNGRWLRPPGRGASSRSSRSRRRAARSRRSTQARSKGGCTRSCRPRICRLARRRCRRSSGSSRRTRGRTCCGSPTGSSSAAPATSPPASPVSAGRSTSSRTRPARAPSRALRTRPGRSRPGSSGQTRPPPPPGSCARSTPRAARSAARLSTSPPRRRPTSASTCRSSLRNEAQRLAIDGDRSAGAVWLIDDRSRRRRVAIATGTSADAAQPLIAPGYYLRRALGPFADVSEWRDSASDPIVSLLQEKPSVLALADMSVAPGPERDAVQKLPRRRRRARALRRRPSRRGRRRLHPDHAPARRPDAGRRAVVGYAEARGAVREAEPVLRPCRPRRGDRHAAGAGGTRGGPRREDLGASRRRHAARHRGAPRQGPDRALPRHGGYDLVEPPAVGPVRRHAASRGRRRPILRPIRRRRRHEGRARARSDPRALAHAERLRRARRSAVGGRADRRRFFGRRRRRASAGSLRPAGLAPRGQRAGRRADAGAGRLRAPEGPLRRARRDAAGRLARMAPSARARRPDGRRASRPLDRRVGAASPPGRDRGADRRRGARRARAPATRPRRGRADQRPRHGRRAVDQARLRHDRRRDRRRDVAARARVPDARPVESHLGRARRAHRRRSRTRRARVLSA